MAEKKMLTYRCLLCGTVFEVEEGVEPVCPVCQAKGTNLILVEDEE